MNFVGFITVNWMFSGTLLNSQSAGAVALASAPAELCMEVKASESFSLWLINVCLQIEMD